MSIIFLAALTLYACTNIDHHFTLPNMVLVFATLFQSFFILYFVHWNWHRFDLSLDTVIKCFASGFVFSTSTAIVVEILVSFVVYFVTGLLGVIALVFEVGNLDMSDPQTFIPALIRENAWLGVLAMFLNAFVVAATTEELSKYFGWFMVETPESLDEKDLNDMMEGADYIPSDMDQTGSTE
eukprot:5793859-Ditylum_brightwellii.AAC.1